MKRRVLLLWRIVHHALFTRLSQHGLVLLFTIRRLFVLLRRIAGATATSTQTVRAAVAFEVVARAHVTTVDPGQDEGHTEAGEAAESHALLIVSELVESDMGGVRRTLVLTAE